MKKFMIILILFPIISIDIIGNEININSMTVFIAEDKVQLKSEPNINSRSIMTIDIGKNVKILKKSNIKMKINNVESNWIFVDTGFLIDYQKSLDTIKGWVLEYYVAYDKDFKKLSSFINCKISGAVGDYGLEYEFNANGTYKQWLYDQKSLVKYNITGKVYGYKGLIYPVDNTGKGADIFYYENGKICSVFIGEDNKRICCK